MGWLTRKSKYVSCGGSGVDYGCLRWSPNKSMWWSSFNGGLLHSLTHCPFI